MIQPKRIMRVIDFKDPKSSGGVLLPLPAGPYIKVPQGREGEYPIGEAWNDALARAEALGDLCVEFAPHWGSIVLGSVGGFTVTVGFYVDTSG